MPRVKLFDEEEALKKALKLFWEKGYAATSLSDLTRHLGIGKGSFYATFNSKRHLFHACFDDYRSTNVSLLQELLSSEPNVKIGLQRLLEFNLEHFISDSKHKGCFMANSCSEIHGESDVLFGKLAEHYNNVEEILVAYLKRGKIKPKKAKSISAMTLTFLIGMSQQSKINRDRINYLGSIKNLVGMLD
ncbi:MAG: TetR/AcrR family transcriptional repressor of nem operon [Bacteroidia bacterium]|jgi:TetR/AcrR family transcriptional repressor of nem operon